MNCDPNGDSLLGTLFVAAALGAVGQLVSDVVTSVMDGELKFSSLSTYVGAAVGGVVSKLIPVPYLSEAIGSATSTAVAIIGDNLINTCTGKGKIVGFEEFVYETTTSAVVGGLVGGPVNDDLKWIYVFPDVVRTLGVRNTQTLKKIVGNTIVPVISAYCTEAIEDYRVRVYGVK